MTSIPIDVVEEIVELLTIDTTLRTIKACSLVCRAWLPVCRKFIFREIWINHMPTRKSRILALQNLLLGAPELAKYIRKVQYRYTPRDMKMKRNTLENTLDMLKGLKSLAITADPGTSWGSFRALLLPSFRVDSLTEISIFRLESFDMMDLAVCPHLETLRLEEVKSLMPYVSPVAFPPPPLRDLDITLSSVFHIFLRASERMPFFNYSKISRLFFGMGYISDYETLMMLLSLCDNISSLTIRVYPILADDDFDLSVINLSDIPALGTLTHLEVVLPRSSFDSDPYRGFTAELERIAGRNILKEIVITTYRTPNFVTSFEEEWGYLDEVLGKYRFKWPKLKTVTLIFDPSDDAIIPARNEVQAKLLEMKDRIFPLLSSNKSLIFNLRIDSAEYEPLKLLGRELYV